MSNGSALALTIATVGFTIALVAACRLIDREPFRTLDRWLAAAWLAAYRFTGAEALDRAIARRRAPRVIAECRQMLAMLPDGPQFDASRARLNSVIDRAEAEARQ